jgi:glucose/arabinose dehydrogenase
MLRRPPLFTALVSALVSLAAALQAFAVPFTVQGPGVNAGDFRVTTFASGLSYPLGMAELPDGSLVVTLVASSSFFSGSSPGMNQVRPGAFTFGFPLMLH